MKTVRRDTLDRMAFTRTSAPDGIVLERSAPRSRRGQHGHLAGRRPRLNQSLKLGLLSMLAGVLLGGASRAHQGESDEAFGEVIPGDAASNVRCEGGVAAGFSCRGVNLLSFMPAGQFGPGVMNEVWGWTDDASGREFVMVGRTDAVEFVEVTDPINPAHIGTLPSPAGSKSS